MGRAIVNIMEDMMSKLSFIKWDRFVDDGEGCISVYGWIDREQDQYKDFVVLDYFSDDHEFYRGFSFISSSAKYDGKIYEILKRSDDGVGDDNVKCKRVEDVFVNVENVIKLKK